MRLTNKLNAQHLGWWFKKKWHCVGKKTPIDTKANLELIKSGVKIEDALEVASPKLIFERKSFKVPEYIPKIPLENETHPDWHDEICYVYKDNNVLLEGIPQAQVLTKTIEIKHLPRNIEEAVEKSKINSITDKNVQNSILSSHVFDAEQEKTAIVKLAERPAFVLPRTYGITDNRKNRLILSKLIFECEKLKGRSISSQRKIVNDAKFIVSLKKDQDQLQFDIIADIFMTSKCPIEPVKGKYNSELPDLFPVKYTNTIPQKNVYTLKDFYPMKSGSLFSNPHTIFLYYSPLDVQNLYETPVTQTQFESRTLLKAFAVAASKAKQMYGEDITDLPQPLVVQSIQTDGKSFHFGVFQLNTLNIKGVNGLTNYWFHLPKMDLFAECTYKLGRPTLDGYNKDIFKYLNAFYCNT